MIKESNTIFAAPKDSLPDVALKQDQQGYKPIDWVGMGAVQIPLRVNLNEKVLQLMAQMQVLVSLDLSPSRGIHMSRMYSLVQSLSQVDFSLETVRNLSAELIASQNKQSMLSSASRIKIEMELPLQRKSLKSDLVSWKVYPVSLLIENKQGQASTTLIEMKIVYSSTCPASAALARDLNSKNFEEHYHGQNVDLAEATFFLNSEPGMIATPHAQRSEARVQVLVQDDFNLNDIETMINVLEAALGTPVQGAVKREDEQEFARLNGANLMFCEDAIRKLSAELDKQNVVSGYSLQVNHLESLHAHNAVSMLKKNFTFLV